MTQVRVEIEGSADEVVRVLWDLGNAGGHATVGDAGVDHWRRRAAAVMMRRRPPGHRARRDPMERAAGKWTEALAGEYLAGLDPAGRRVAFGTCGGLARRASTGASCASARS